MKNIVVIGGGTGTYTILRGLKKYPVHLTAIVSMMDSGGSNRVLRDEFGLLPTSDIRQCMVALADESQNEVLRDLFTYRFSQGVGIAGMTFGNLFMAALTNIYGSQKEALEKTCELLHIKGEILPVTYDNVQLVARYENGRQRLGEHFIDEPTDNYGSIVELSTIPDASVNPQVVDAIAKADCIIFGPGDLFTSTIANLTVDGMRGALSASEAEVIFVVNLMTKFGQTDGFSASDHVKTLEKYLGRPVNCVLMNEVFDIAPELAARYEEEQAELVINDLGEGSENLTVIEDDFVSDSVYEKGTSDKLKRSLIRHDSDKLAKTIIKYLEG